MAKRRLKLRKNQGLNYQRFFKEKVTVLERCQEKVTVLERCPQWVSREGFEPPTSEV